MYTRTYATAGIHVRSYSSRSPSHESLSKVYTSERRWMDQNRFWILCNDKWVTPTAIGFTCTPGWGRLERADGHTWVVCVRDAASLNESRRRTKHTIRRTVRRDNYKSVINNRRVTVNRLVDALAGFHLAPFHPICFCFVIELTLSHKWQLFRACVIVDTFTLQRQWLMFNEEISSYSSKMKYWRIFFSFTFICIYIYIYICIYICKDFLLTRQIINQNKLCIYIIPQIYN